MKFVAWISIALNVVLIAVLGFGASRFLSAKTSTKAPVKQAVTVQTAELGKTVNIVSQGVYLNLLTAQKSNRVVAGGKVYTATNGDTFFIVTINVANTGDAPANVMVDKLVSVTADQKPLALYLDPKPITIVPASVMTNSLVYLTKDTVNQFSVAAETASGKKQEYSITYK